MSNKKNRAPRITGPDGRKVSLHDLPLVAYTLTCGHIGRDYAIAKGDQVFCTACADTKRVARVIS
jgi:hypothetical protein